jgi:hypothetical protein
MSLIKKYGRKKWAFAGCRIPVATTGKEPQFTSQDRIAILNTTDQAAEIKISIFFVDKEAIRNYSITVMAQRIRKIKFNDLIDPLPIPLDEPFGFVLQSNTQVIVQFSRMNTENKYIAGFISTPFCQNPRNTTNE